MAGWGEARKRMDAALKTITVPLLRERGFQGTYPFFYRVREDATDFVGFLFHRFGPAFTIELACVPGKRLAPTKPASLEQYSAKFRVRLGQLVSGGYDDWFEFQPRMPPIGTELLRRSVESNPQMSPPDAEMWRRAAEQDEDERRVRAWGPRVFEERAKAVNQLLPVADRWFQNPARAPTPPSPGVAP